jgi:hypothetical protein
MSRLLHCGAARREADIETHSDENFRQIFAAICDVRLKLIADSTRLSFQQVHTFSMAIRINKAAPEDHWLARASFGLFVAGLAAWLVALYWTAPLDF